MSFDPAQILRERFAAAITAAFPEHAGADPLIAISKNPKFGEFQCNAAMSLAKLVGKPPREVAAAIVSRLDLGDLAEPVTDKSIAGPGFINITLRSESLGGLLAKLAAPSLGIDPVSGADKKTIVVDLCGVNLAKQMHIGHLRSTVIGDTLARILERLGHNVIRQNHVGDWGLPIAMVTERLMRQEREGKIDLAKLTLEDLDVAYKAAKRDCEADTRGLAAAKLWHMGPKAIAELEAQVAGAQVHERAAKDVLLRLQSHDADVMRVWQRISDVTMSACLAICARLNADVRPEHSAGESFYAADLAPLVVELQNKGITEESEGALIIRLDDVGIAEPLILRKSDGGFLYATTDIAAVRYRVGKLKAQRVVYCVDARQGLHFKQFFAAARKAGFAGNAILEHAAFGTILGEDGKPFKSRSGDTLKLSDVIDEAVAAADVAVAARNAEMSSVDRAPIAQAVAIAAIRYTDLSSERIKDYVFSLPRMVKFEGDTGPYMLYAVARTRSILRKAGISPTDVPPGAFTVAHAAEKTLALTLLRYPETVRDVARTLEPHRLCALLYELAGAFSSFFDQCPVLAAPDEATRLARLRLCALTDRVLSDGLSLLGIRTLDRM